MNPPNRKLRHDLMGLLEPLRMSRHLIVEGKMQDGLELLDLSIDSISNLANLCDSFMQSERAEPKFLNQYNSIVIDDDELYLETCRVAARSSDFKPLLFSSFDHFENCALNLNKLVPLFIDSQLGKDATKGELQIPRLRELGFKQIYINTAEVSLVNKHHGANDVLDKSIPKIKAIVASCDSN